MKMVTFIILYYLKILNGNPQLKMALIYQVLTNYCMKKSFPTTNYFVPNGPSFLN